MVALAVVGKALGGDLVQQFFQRVQVGGAGNFGAVRPAKDKVAKGKLLGEQPPKVAQHGGRTFAQKRVALGMGAGHELGPAGLEHDRNIRRQSADQVRQLEARVRRQLAAKRKLDIGDHAEQVLAVGERLLRRVLVIRTEQNLGPGAHAHQLVGDVEAFAEQTARLRDQLGINHRQKRRAVADVVFDQKNDRNPHHRGVVEDIALVLDVLDEGDQNADIALPKENPFDIGHRITGDEILDLTVIVGQHDDRHIEAGLLDLPRQLVGAHRTHRQIGDDEIEARIRARQRNRLRAAGDMGDSGDVLEMQFERVADQQFVEPSVLAQNEGIVEARHQQDVPHPEGHELLEGLEEFFRIGDRLG